MSANRTLLVIYLGLLIAVGGFVAFNAKFAENLMTIALNGSNDPN